MAKQLPVRDSTLESLIASQAVAVGTVGNPANQVMSVTEANDRVLLDQVSSSSVGVMLSQLLPSSGTPYTVVSLDIVQIGSGGSIQLQGRNDEASAWTTVQVSFAINNNVSNSIGGTGLAYAYFPFSQIRIFQSAITSGTTKVRVMLLKGTPVTRAVGVSGAPVGFLKPGNVVMQGLRARTSLPAITSEDFCIEAQSTLDGVPVHKPYSIPQADWAYAATSGGITGVTATPIKAAAGGGIRNYVTSMQMSNDSATATEVMIRDAVSTAVIWRTKAQANMPTTAFTFPVPLKGTANSALEVVLGTAGAAVYINLQGYISGAMG